ncbi:MAG: DUF134 domain-containing protein [Oscillospiraceae bacterium]|nr:DUF134 domain-containing protein [Oscillospiraceae bacterium]
MPRPIKCRMICRFPQTLEFTPAPDGEDREPVILTVDEYETIRLIDREGLSQEQCSQRMQIARTTAQKIYDCARRKLADVLVDGRPLKIEGGEYRLCNGGNRSCGAAMCYRQEINQIFQIPKGDNTMRIAVTYENGQVYQHFGHTEQFKIYDVEDGAVTSSQVVGTNGQGHGALAEVLGALQADILICGGIGGGAQAALASAGIKLYGGVTGDADAAVQALLAGSLNYVPDIRCSHHEGEHSGAHCGEHGGHPHGEGHECRHGHCGG